MRTWEANSEINKKIVKINKIGQRMEEYPLHECVFNGDVIKLSRLIRTHDIAERDYRGNTPLHLAVMKGYKECVHLLLAHGAPVKIKNNLGWNPLAEGISYGDRQTILSLLQKLKQQSRETLERRRPVLIQHLRDLRDFYLELKWDFHSWVPFVSRILPSDICRIYKFGPCIRLDTTLVDFNDMHWERGDITFIFDGDAKPAQSLIVLDNKLKVFQRIRYEETEIELEDEVDVLMSSDIMSAQMSTKNISFTHAQSGWLFREDKHEMVGKYRADYYIINGMSLESRKRREHLSQDDMRKNKALMESLSKGIAIESADSEPTEKRTSLKPPPPSLITWHEYLRSHHTRPVRLGRPMVAKENSKLFKATLAMSRDFPMTIKALLDVLEVIAPFKHFQKLRDFMMTQLPPGFPVKIEIPVFPTVTAKVTFNTFEWRHNLPQSSFTVPSNYRENPNRFPDL